jgi:aerobic carbon-monoxide dehydrogenase large subunit
MRGRFASVTDTAAVPRPGSILGTRVLRTEDPGLLTGSRKYLADLVLPGKLHAVFVRSDVAHGTIQAIHVDDAAAMPGVVEILAAAELGVAPHHGFATVHDDFARPPLADGRVRFVGEPIAVVLAETFEQGEDAAEVVWADIDELDRVHRRRVGPRGPRRTSIFADHGDNQALVIVDKPAPTSRPRTWWCAAGTSTSAWRWCRWSPTAAPPRSATTAA